MSESEKQIVDTLKSIKEGDGKQSATLDGHVIRDLIDIGYVKGLDVTTLGAKQPEYVELRVTVSGSQYLESSNQNPEKSDPKKDPSVGTPAWYSNPFLIAALSLVVLVIGYGALHFLGWS